nr:FxsA family protein [Paracoccaceae bacterium]
LVVAGTVAGAAILRGRGVGMVLDMRRSLDRGEDPAAALVHGALAVLAGLMLLVPGFLTDAIGLALLLPPVQAAITARLRAAGASRGGHPGHDPTVFDGTWHEVLDTAPSRDRQAPSGWTRH